MQLENISQQLDESVIFEDQDLLVINKPAGVISNQADTHSETSVQSWLEARLETLTWPDDWQSLLPADFHDEFGTPEQIMLDRKGLVHRLDKDTSGLMVCAKHPGSLVALLAAFRDRQIEKHYLCLVHGKILMAAGKISAPLARSKRDRSRFVADASGRPAETIYKVEQLYVTAPELFSQLTKRAVKLYEPGFSLLECHPLTGRTHQIRVHLAHIKHPLVGDSKYTGKKRASLDPNWCPRQFLHASSLQFIHPRHQLLSQFNQALPDDLLAALKNLRVLMAA